MFFTQCINFSQFIHEVINVVRTAIWQTNINDKQISIIARNFNANESHWSYAPLQHFWVSCSTRLLFLHKLCHVWSRFHQWQGKKQIKNDQDLWKIRLSGFALLTKSLVKESHHVCGTDPQHQAKTSSLLYNYTKLTLIFDSPSGLSVIWFFSIIWVCRWTCLIFLKEQVNKNVGLKRHLANSQDLRSLWNLFHLAQF